MFTKRKEEDGLFTIGTETAGKRAKITAGAMLLAMSVAAVPLLSPAPASAASRVTITNTAYPLPAGILFRAAADMNSAKTGPGGYDGDWADLVCGTWGTAVGPFANRRWHIVRTARGQGYIADRYLTTPNAANQLTPGEPECGAPQPANGADQWARNHVGATTPTAAEQNGNAAYGWSGWCYLFAYDAYYFGMGRRDLPTGRAIDVMNTYAAQGRLSGGTPPAGALVFWGANPANSAGHAAISIGSGRIIGTRGFEGAGLPISEYAITDIPNYRGYVNP